MSDTFDSLERRLGYRFHDRELLRTALTHGSRAETARSLKNERLEYLGDAVVSLAVAGRLYRGFPQDTEGGLSAKRAMLASRDALAGVARHVGLGDHIRIGKGQERTAGRDNPTILADLLESLLGAVAVEAGTDTALELAETLIFDRAEAVLKDEKYVNYKSRLLERCQADTGNKPAYELTGTTGPDHRQHFYVRVLIDGAEAGSGAGPNKKNAEQAAARNVLENIKDNTTLGGQE